MMAIDRPVKADESCCRGWELGFESEAEAREAAACVNLFPLAVEMLRWVRSYVDGGEEAFNLAWLKHQRRNSMQLRCLPRKLP